MRPTARTQRFFAPLRMTILALGLVAGLAGTLLAATGTMRTERFTSIREHDRLILALEDSCLCDTSMTTDSRSVTYLACCDSGRVFVHMSPSPFASRGVDKGDSVAWFPRMLLSRSSRCASPIVFELLEPGREPLMVVMWREEAAGLIRVMRSHLYPGVFPPQWSVPLEIGSRLE
jgi:hypothetical protein